MTHLPLFFSKSFCRFVHGRFSDGDEVDSEFTGKELADAFDNSGQFIGEMMEYVISNWKADPATNYVYQSGNRVLLSPYFVPVNLNVFLHMHLCFLSYLQLLFFLLNICHIFLLLYAVCSWLGQYGVE